MLDRGGADTEIVEAFDGGGEKHGRRKGGNRRRGKPKLLNGCQMKVRAVNGPMRRPRRSL